MTNLSVRILEFLIQHIVLFSVVDYSCQPPSLFIVVDIQGNMIRKHATVISVVVGALGCRLPFKSG